jgi:transposase
MTFTTIAVDVANAVFEVAVSERPRQDASGIGSRRERFRRYLGEQPPVAILMKACGSAHYWARQAEAHGHRALLLPPYIVRPYVVRNKTDRTDAKGLLEAVRNEEARPVSVKSETQQAVTAHCCCASSGSSSQ